METRLDVAADNQTTLVADLNEKQATVDARLDKI